MLAGQECISSLSMGVAQKIRAMEEHKASKNISSVMALHVPCDRTATVIYVCARRKVETQTTTLGRLCARGLAVSRVRPTVFLHDARRTPGFSAASCGGTWYSPAKSPGVEGLSRLSPGIIHLAIPIPLISAPVYDDEHGDAGEIVLSSRCISQYSPLPLGY